MQAQDILHFWFTELTDKQRFAKDEALDATLRERFGATLQAAARGELFGWRATPQGRLAEIVVLDQLPRNLYRDTPGAFAQDPQALTLAQELVASGQGQALDLVQRTFCLHALHAQRVAVDPRAGAGLVRAAGHGENTLDFAQRHQAIIAHFGRYPYRNAILGRVSTPEELAFLALPGSSS